MAMLTAEMQAQILALHYSDRRSIKSIAREFGIDRKSRIGKIKGFFRFSLIYQRACGVFHKDIGSFCMRVFKGIFRFLFS